jgi:DOPA 4,5-dioxygenase
MSDASPDRVPVNGYHAHVYYDTATRPLAEWLAKTIGSKFSVEFGGFRDGPVGPHPIANLQIIFTTAEFPKSCPG